MKTEIVCKLILNEAVPLCVIVAGIHSSRGKCLYVSAQIAIRCHKEAQKTNRAVLFNLHSLTDSMELLSIVPLLNRTIRILFGTVL